MAEEGHSCLNCFRSHRCRDVITLLECAAGKIGGAYEARSSMFIKWMSLSRPLRLQSNHNGIGRQFSNLNGSKGTVRNGRKDGPPETRIGPTVLVSDGDGPCRNFWEIPWQNRIKRVADDMHQTEHHRALRGHRTGRCRRVKTRWPSHALLGSGSSSRAGTAIITAPFPPPVGATACGTTVS